MCIFLPTCQMQAWAPLQVWLGLLLQLWEPTLGLQVREVLPLQLWEALVGLSVHDQLAVLPLAVGLADRVLRLQDPVSEWLPLPDDVQVGLWEWVGVGVACCTCWVAVRVVVTEEGLTAVCIGCLPVEGFFFLVNPHTKVILFCILRK